MKFLEQAWLLILILSGCAVPFETTNTLNMGQTEEIIGYTAPSNLTFRATLGLTGYTNVGVGLDTGLHLTNEPVPNLYITGKQKILSIGKKPHYNLLFSGAYGKIPTDLNPEKIPYYHYTLLLGIEEVTTAILLGIGILQDPRYSWELMHEEFSKETYVQMLIGIEINKFLIQTQLVYKGEDSDRDSDQFISLGVGRRF